MAEKYSENCDNESGSFLSHQLEAIRVKAFKAGWDASERNIVAVKNAQYEVEIESLTTERDRLKSALEDLVSTLKHCGMHTGGLVRPCVENAEKALGPSCE